MSIRHWFITAPLLIAAGCSSHNSSVLTRLNETAALPPHFPADPLQWQIITCGVDPSTATMFTLFGNEIAVLHARSSSKENYPEGSMLALATWRQQEDSRWFGAKIPARLQSVDFIDVQAATGGSSSIRYRAYDGPSLEESTILKSQADRRAAYVFSLRAAVMP
jgi:hypothetical protein